MVIEETEFKGHKILIIKNEKGRIFFSAGLTKIKLILLYLKELEDFVKRNEKNNV